MNAIIISGLISLCCSDFANLIYCPPSIPPTMRCLLFFFFKQKTAYEISACLVGSEMCIRDSFYVTAQDTPAFRGICLGDTINEVLDKFPCVDRELKQWAEQYVYGEAGTDNYAELSFVADSFYSLSFFLHGQRRATIGFSRVQQRVFCLLYTSPSPRDRQKSRMPSSA